jgi:hypothetical protein
LDRLSAILVGDFRGCFSFPYRTATITDLISF